MGWELKARLERRARDVRLVHTSRFLFRLAQRAERTPTAPSLAALPASCLQRIANFVWDETLSFWVCVGSSAMVNMSDEAFYDLASTSRDTLFSTDDLGVILPWWQKVGAGCLLVFGNAPDLSVPVEYGGVYDFGLARLDCMMDGWPGDFDQSCEDRIVFWPGTRSTKAHCTLDGLLQVDWEKPALYTLRNSDPKAVDTLQVRLSCTESDASLALAATSGEMQLQAYLSEETGFHQQVLCKTPDEFRELHVDLAAAWLLSQDSWPWFGDDDEQLYCALREAASAHFTRTWKATCQHGNGWAALSRRKASRGQGGQPEKLHALFESASSSSKISLADFRVLFHIAG